jgi:hypothetical protein
VKIGVGFRGIRSRAGAAFFFAGCLLLLAFVADTATTAIATKELRQCDRNPMVRGLSLPAYLAFSFARAAASLAILWWFWPAELTPRFRSRLALLAVPLAYKRSLDYFGAVLVLIAVPLKTAAFVSNGLVLAGMDPAPNARAVVAVGGLAGVFFSNGVLFCHWKRLRKKQSRARSA